MPLLFLIAGIILIVTVIRGTTGSLAGHLRDDVSSGYLKWLVAILVIGIIGYVGPLKEPSRYLMALVALVIFLTGGSGFIDALMQQLSNPGTASTTTQPGGNANLPAIPVQTQAAGASTGSAIGAAIGGGNSALTTASTIASVVGPLL